MTSDFPGTPPGDPAGRLAIRSPRADRGSGTLAGCLGCFGFLLGLTAVTLALAATWIFGQVLLSDAYVTLARATTGGHPKGMAAAAWLLFVATSVGILTIVLIRGRVARRWTRTIGTVTTVLGIIAWYLMPIRNSGLAETVDGSGGSGFITGARWGALSAATLVIIAIHVQARKRAKDFYVRHSLLRWAVGAALAIAVAGLVTAVVRAR